MTTDYDAAVENFRPRKFMQDEFSIGHLVTKRGTENVHLLLWATKDLLWMRVADYRVIIVVAFIALGWSFWQLTSDIYLLFTPTMKNPAQRHLAVKEVPCTLAQTFWLYSNMWWAIGENYDLHFNACYCDIYKKFAAQAAWPLYLAFLIGLGLTAYQLVVSVFPDRGAYAAIYEDTLVGKYVRIMRAKGLRVEVGSPEVVGEAMEYWRLVDLAQSKKDAQVKGSKTAHNDTNNSHGSNEYSSEESSDASIEEEAFKDEDKPNIALGSSCSSSTDIEDGAPSEKFHSCDLPGMPRLLPGVIRVPAGSLNLNTRQIEPKSKWVYNRGVVSYRDFELVVLLLWITKDVSWLWEDGGAAIIWSVSSVLVWLVTLVGFILSVKYLRGVVEKLNAVCLFVWITSNIIWAYGEVWTEESVDNVPELPADAIDFLVPPLFTKPSDLPGGAWTLRFIASWIMVGNVIIMLGLYVYMFAHTLKKSIKQRKSDSAGAVSYSD